MTDAARERELRAAIDTRPDRPDDAICEAIANAVSEAIIEGQFGEHLRQSGWRLVHVGTGDCPDPPGQWLHDGLDASLPGWVDPLGSLESLWREAWQAGFDVGRANPGGTR